MKKRTILVGDRVQDRRTGKVGYIRWTRETEVNVKYDDDPVTTWECPEDLIFLEHGLNDYFRNILERYIRIDHWVEGYLNSEYASVSVPMEAISKIVLEEDDE